MVAGAAAREQPRLARVEGRPGRAGALDAAQRALGVGVPVTPRAPAPPLSTGSRRGPDDASGASLSPAGPMRSNRPGFDASLSRPPRGPVELGKDQRVQRTAGLCFLRDQHDPGAVEELPAAPPASSAPSRALRPSSRSYQAACRVEVGDVLIPGEEGWRSVVEGLLLHPRERRRQDGLRVHLGDARLGHFRGTSPISELQVLVVVERDHEASRAQGASRSSPRCRSFSRPTFRARAKGRARSGPRSCPSSRPWSPLESDTLHSRPAPRSTSARSRAASR